MAQSVVLAAVGDIMLGDMACSYGFGVGSQIERHGPFFPFERSAELLRKANLVTGNLECALSHFDRDRDPFSHVQLRGTPEAAQGLARAGMNVLNLANNHIMQHGMQALEETVDALRKHNIAIVGIDLPSRNVRNLSIMKQNGVAMAMLGYNFRPHQYFLDNPCDVRGEEQRILADIAAVREQVDAVILSLHWGDEFVNYPSAEQVRLGRKLIDGGATVILGHHPHTLQGVEEYKQGLIAYSLGDFVFDLWQDRLRRSMVLFCTMSRSGLESFEVAPMEINLTWQPEPLDEDGAAEELKAIEALAGQVSDSRPDPEYRAEVIAQETRFRREVYTHHMRNLHRYDLLRLFGNAFGAIRRRL